MARRIFWYTETHVLGEITFFFGVTSKTDFCFVFYWSLSIKNRAILPKICRLTQFFKLYRMACPLRVKKKCGCALKINRPLNRYPWKWKGNLESLKTPEYTKKNFLTRVFYRRTHQGMLFSIFDGICFLHVRPILLNKIFETNFKFLIFIYFWWKN